MKQLLVTFLASYLVLIGVLNFFAKLKEHSQPIKEVEVTYLHPPRVFDILVDIKCPNELGHLDEFLDCLKKYKVMYRTDM